jgi:hypothetical protein
MWPYGWLAIVYAAVLYGVFSLFTAHGPRDRKALKVRNDWKPRE